MKMKLFAVFSAICVLSGCNALDGKCDYLPPDHCDCSNSPFDASFYNCNCRKYKIRQVIQEPRHCGPCTCKTDTCNDCWACGTNYKFHD